MKETMKKETMNASAMLQALLMLLTAAKLTSAVKWLKNTWTNTQGLTFDESLEETGKNLYVGDGGTTKTGATLIRYLANTFGAYVGKAFYVIPTKGGGFNANLAKSTAIAILCHIGLTDEKGVILDTDNFGANVDDITLKFSPAFIAPVVEEKTTTEFGHGSTDDDDDDDDDDEFDDFSEVVSASDEVVSINWKVAKATYPLATLFMSFFEMIKSCGSAVGTVLDFSYVRTSGASPTNWRGENGAKAIANGDTMYRNGAGKPKDVKCVSSFSKDKEHDNMFKHDFSYILTAPIVLRSLGFNFGNRNGVFGHMVDTYFDGNAKAGFGFITAGMRLIMNAVDNGADASAIGVGFRQYLDADDIYHLIDTFGESDDDKGNDFYPTLKAGSNRGSASVVDASFDEVLN
jgi:hypothetical protein